MITIQVIENKTGKPVKDSKVSIYKPWGGGFKKGYTNADGEVSIDFELPCKGELAINGNKVHEGEMKAYMKLYI
ncbi:hypothetical protein [Nostoc sp. 2RC]|uniref:hypothetical protein n=1 Tax=Nostoc sp. 2RC TaxID=2485484 RepID=UPI001623ACC9|nr:hypothetical protein [Nostoc sp. 2RC]MBC1238523.1 hypothetical protein [Nostoc sp. 2RC]